VLGTDPASSALGGEEMAGGEMGGGPGPAMGADDVLMGSGPAPAMAGDAMAGANPDPGFASNDSWSPTPDAGDGGAPEAAAPEPAPPMDTFDQSVGAADQMQSDLDSMTDNLSSSGDGE
jgi:hypothetical protein